MAPILVGLGGFEPPTSPLSGVRSDQLSYRPKSSVCRLPLGTTDRRTIESSVWAPDRSPRLCVKEVIQPHLPVRLPCYDFTPVIDHTVDGALPEGLGYRLLVQPTPMV